ncbi:MAG: hemolysin family protein [Phycisphaerales bacterium]
MPADLTLLIVYLALAVGVSFLCSLCEAGILTLTASDAKIMANAGKPGAALLARMKQQIDRPLAAILTLNTISHTVGAAGVGAQSLSIWGDKWVAVTSAVLTLVILVGSEIIPKTLGAVYARPLATPTVYMIQLMIWVSLPIVVPLNLVSRLFKGGGHQHAMTREQVEVMAEMARTGGAIDHAESSLITNMLALRNKRVEEVMTPRTVVFMLDQDETVDEVLAEHAPLRFSRILVTGKGVDDVKGIVLKHDIHQAALAGRRSRTVGSMLRKIQAVPEQAPLLSVMEQFGQTGHHLFLVVDEYGGTAGVVTLEDVLETILGAEIVDETDPVADMRHLATGQDETPSR